MNATLKTHPAAGSAQHTAEALLSAYEKIAGAVASAVSKYVAAAEAEMKAQRAIDDLYGMSDRELRDIGITRGEIEQAVRGQQQ